MVVYSRAWQAGSFLHCERLSCQAVHCLSLPTFPCCFFCCLQGSATLSMAYAGALFADACLRGLNGDPDVIECSYVASSITEVPFFSSKVKLGKNGELPGAAGLQPSL